MKQFSKVLAPVAMAAAVLWAPHASAALIYSGANNALGNTYIGAYNSLNSDIGSFQHLLTATGGFTDLWLFNFSPIGSATMNANFVPTTFIAGFTVELLNVTSACTTLTVAGSSCTSVVPGSLIATGVPGIASSNIGFTGLSAGQYAIRVTGTVGQQPVLYTGQLATSPVPEPSSLALAGLALFGLAVSLRKSKAS